MRPANDVIAIACSDIHLCHTAPLCRRKEEDWYDVMGRTLNQLKEIQKRYKVPILCAGDVFDKWNPTPELINWAIANMPERMWCIPGQHDLPLHKLDDVYKSAYWTLVVSGVVQNVVEPVDFTTFMLHPFPWGVEVSACLTEKSGLHIAMIHEYTWIPGHNYTGASIRNRVGINSNVKTYDVAIFGDNHSGFIHRTGRCNVINCGTLMRRKSDEADYKPMVGLIYEDGSIKPHYMNTSKDRLDPTVKEPETQPGMDVKAFLEQLQTMSSEHNLDFRFAIEQAASDNRVSENVREVLLEALESEAR